MTIVKTYSLPNNRELRIIQEHVHESPRAWCNLGTMICAHRRYHLGDEQCYSKLRILQFIADRMGITEIIEDLDLREEVYEDSEKLEQWLKSREDWVCLPLFLYDHSGLSMSTTPFSCPWDSGQVGFIFCTTETIIKEYGEVSEENLEKAVKALENEVKIYDYYLQGEVYTFQIINQNTSEEELEDFCGGFYGGDIEENGILEHLSEEDKQHVLQAIHGKAA